MWKKPWGASEGACICGGLVVIGLAMQLSVGSIVWKNFAWPFNIILLGAFLAFLIIIFLLRKRLYPVRWALTSKAAVPAILFVTAATLIMGLVRQDVLSSNPLARMLSFWPFVLLYCWMAMLLGLAVISRICSFSWRKLPSLLNHAGLFMALVCATLGSADMQRLTMVVQVGNAEWRATDADGNMHELPLAIELQEFVLDEYPPKLMMIDNNTGAVLPEGRPEQVSIDSTAASGKLCGWDIKVKELIEYAASAASADTIRYVEWLTVGATNAAYIEAVSSDGKQRREGWVSCGSFLFPYQALRIDSLWSIVMPDREPRKFTSKVTIYTQSGTITQTDIEVNKPAKIEGWKIYLLSYDEVKGRWSDVSKLELVSDPWLPFVYVGIFIMLCGAVSMFITANRRKEGTS